MRIAIAKRNELIDHHSIIIIHKSNHKYQTKYLA
jgi:hypothetical protein